jgi:hypothetical protein
MNLKFIRLLALLILLPVSLWFAMPASLSYADGPTTGLFPAGMPWPTAYPLGVGTPFAPAIFSSPPHNAPAIVVVPPPPPSPAPRVNSNSGTNTVRATPRPSPAPAIVVAPAPTSVPAPVVVASTSQGTSPENPIKADDVWRKLDPGGVMWFQVGGIAGHIDAWLDVNVDSNMKMEIFAPNRSLSEPPIGQGTQSKNASSRWNWAGGSWRASGAWLARITNGNAMPVQFKVGSTEQALSWNCHSYWEWINQDYVYWTACE